MNVKNLFISFLLLITLTIFTPHAFAEEKTSLASANFAGVLKTKVGDNRAKVLQAYLQAHNSPMAPFANTFVQDADTYNLDWRLLPAIAGVESTFGQAEPVNCYNGWGYGIYGNNMMCFYSYYEAIHTISQALREKYINTWGATDVYSIGHIYAASPTWADRVTYFMNDIEAFKENTDNQTLPISL